MPQTIQYLYNETFTEKAIVVEDQTVTVRGSTSARLNESKLSRTKITIDSKITAGSSLIEVGLNGSVHFTNLDLVPNTKASLLHISSVSRGASMENVGIMLTSGQTYQYSLIKTENQPITIENTLINTTAATLAILLEPFLTVATNADTPVAMKNVTFENLNMKTESILQIQSAGSITLDKVKFINSTRTTGEDGLYVRINADNLRRQIKPAFWPDSFVGTQAQKDFFGTDEFLGKEHEWYDASLMYYLVPPILKIKLDKNGGEASTHPNCGSDRFVCSTLDSGYRSAEANEMDQVELFSDTSLAKTMTLAIPIQMRSSSESVVRKVTQEGQSGIIVSLEAPERASLFHMIFTFSGTPIDNFISVESGSLYLFKTTFGTATQQTLASSLHTLARVKTGSTLSLEETTFQNLAFSHESLGSAIFVENGGILSADRGSIFSGLTSVGKGVHVYLVSSDLSTQTKETPYTLFKSTLPLQTGTIFTRAQRNMFFGEMEGVTGSLLSYWYPHTANEDTLSVTTEGDDHVVCGIPELPCASFDHGFRSLKKSGTKIIVSSSSSVKSALTTEFETVVIEGDVSTRILTFTNAGSMRVNEGQIYTLRSLCMEIEDGTRTEAVIAVAGSVVTNGISFGKTTPVTINTPLVEVTSGSFSLSTTTIKNIATLNSKSLFVMSSGTLGLTQVGFTWAGLAQRILSQSAGSSVVSGCTFTIGGEGSTLASSNLLEVSGGTLQLSDLTLDCTQKQISSLVTLNGGQATLSKLLITNSILTSSLVAGSGALSITESTFSSQVDSSFTSNSASSTLSFTVPSGKSLTVGDGVKPFSFQNCKSSSDGGAIVLEVENEGSSTLNLVTFTSCESGGAGGGMKATVKTGGELTITQTSFTGCSSIGEGGALNVIVVGTGKVSIDGTFKKCESKSNAGAVLLDASSLGSSGSFVLNSIVFGTNSNEMNKAGTGFKGHNLFIKTPAGDHASITASSLTGSYLTLPANSNTFTQFETEQYTFCETNGAPTSILYLFNAYEGGKLIVDETNGMDHELCGHPRLPCSSLTQSLGNLKGQDMIASLDTDITLTTSASSTKQSAVEPRSNGRKTITMTENVTINIVSSTLTLSSLKFVVSAALFSKSAVSITGGSLIVDDCVFDSISSSHSGAAISGTIQNGQSLTVTSSSFLTCVSKGDGGAISVECGDQVEADSLTIKATFTDCLCGGESKGSDVYVVGHDLARVIRKENWEGYPPEWNDTTENVVWGEDKQKIGTQFESLPLLFYLIPFFNITITTGGSGSDADGCGSSRLLCQSFSLAHTHLKGEGSHTFIIASSNDLDEIEIFQPNDITVRSESNTALLTGQKDGALHFNFDVGTSFNARVVDLVFKIDSEDVAPLIVSKNALLSISTCQFNKEDSFARSIVELVSGTFSLSSTSFSGATFDVPAFLLSTFTSAEIKSLSVTSCTVSEFIVAKSGEKLTLENTNFTSFSSSPQPEQNSDDSICSWTTGLLKFENTATTLKNCSFNGWTQGSVNQIGGSLTLGEVSFTNGNASSEFSSSINRNVHCEANGKVDVVSLQAGSDGTDTQPSAWIDAKKCEITSTTKIHKSSLFVPTLDSTKSSSDHHYKYNTAKIALYGTLVLPCDLVLEVFEWDNKTTNAELNSTTLNLSSIPTTNWTEDLINFTLNFTEKLKVLDSKYEWRGRLVYGMGAKTENWVKIKASAAEIRKSQSSETMKWLLPLIIGLSLLFLLLFFIILIICLRRRKKNKEDEKPEALPMLSAAEMPEEMFQSDNDADKDKPSLDFDENDNKPAVIPAAAIPPKEEPDAEEEEKEIDDLEDFEEAMACDGTGQLKPVNKNKTLYKVLHGPKKSDDTDINDLQNQLLTGLTYVAGSDPNSKILTMLSPHSVLLEGNKVFLAIPKEEEKRGKAPRKKRGEDGHEAQRWEAPEITDHVPDSSGEKAAVFSLGLILLEFQTGQVPFGHMDAAVATRQLGAGILPDMDGVSEELTEIIQQCVLSNPDERPTLADVQEVLKAE
ncbi:hypothetical protein BLNAU_3055 [Blattamonas nauphoetae]|uniref:Protein kinase domain-containing protein n=1 Tax=Blattamonas nauphoetae TaxID=2049346 RepID=A0ABQ9YEI0_9EUKA|nr:hypothetical protein BLNAU_3055 [Blattamonas nauphoetae]